MKAKSDRLFIYDIANCCHKIQSFVANRSKDDFEKDVMLQDALVRNLEIIGEASKNLSSELRDSAPNINWRDIMRMRDKIVHHYFRIDLDIVWQTVAEDIPQLTPKIEAILEVITQQ